MHPYPQHSLCIFVISAWKWTLCLVDLELLGQLGLLTGLKMDEIGWSSHRKLNFVRQFYSKRSLKLPLQNRGVQYRYGYKSLRGPWTPIFYFLGLIGITILYRINNKKWQDSFFRFSLGLICPPCSLELSVLCRCVLIFVITSAKKENWWIEHYIINDHWL